MFIMLQIDAVTLRTVYGKMFEGENFCGFHGFSPNR